MSWKYKKLIGALLEAEKNAPPESGGLYSAAVAFPNQYRLGMAHLGFHWAWRTIAAHPSFNCDRFLPE